jgi:hypothetical protein
LTSRICAAVILSSFVQVDLPQHINFSSKHKTTTRRHARLGRHLIIKSIKANIAERIVPITIGFSEY